MKHWLHRVNVPTKVLTSSAWACSHLRAVRRALMILLPSAMFHFSTDRLSTTLVALARDAVQTRRDYSSIRVHLEWLVLFLYHVVEPLLAMVRSSPARGPLAVLRCPRRNEQPAPVRLEEPGNRMGSDVFQGNEPACATDCRSNPLSLLASRLSFLRSLVHTIPQLYLPSEA